MQIDSVAAPGGLAWLPLFVILPSLISVLASQKRAQAIVGRSVVEDRPGRWRRRALLCGPQVLVLAIVLLRNDLGQDSPAECLMLGILLAWSTPGARDAVLGESGVRRGWTARRFEDLEAWRFTDDHLWFQVHGEWTSVPCPSAQQMRVRPMLTAASEAEASRFRG